MSNSNYKGIVMKQPATRWQDALPCGNGRLGALIYGHIKDEMIIMNHENFWLRHEKPKLKPVHMHLNEYRQMLLNGKYKEGLAFFTQKLKENYSGDPRPAPFQPLFDIKVHMGVKKAFQGYSRSLDFRTGEALVQWSEEDVKYHRRLFVSRADNAVVLNIGASKKGCVNCEVTLEAHDSQGAGGMGSGKDIGGVQLPFTYDVFTEGEIIIFNGVQNNGDAFGGVAKTIITGGSITKDNHKVIIKNADNVLIITKPFVYEQSTIAIERIKQELMQLPKDYSTLFESHVSLHRELFDRMRLDLGGKTEKCLSNEELLLKAYDGDVPIDMIQKMFDYGRYLLISSSCPGGLPANLQGVWNGDYEPAWASDYHNDENIQMNYWAALPGNLAETTLAFFDYYESMLADYRTNAKNVYGCRGIFAPIAQTTHGIIYGASVWSAWTAGAGWLAQLFYDYWLFTGDEAFLKNRAVPFLKEVALFYEDFLIEGPDGKYMFAPSLSPENQPSIDEPSLATVNATMDIAVAREVLSNLCSACRTLHISSEEIKKWEKIIDKLPEYEINEDGAVKEWIHPDLKDNYHHRHQSHIYPLFPGFEVTEENHLKLYNAMHAAVEKRLVIGLSSQTGWSFAHMSNIYARLGDGNRALECIELLCRSCVGSNFFTYHNDWRSQGLTMFWGHKSQPPFQIDANFGLTAAVIEMLVFSAPGIIKLLPALPDSWVTGKVENVLCRGGITANIEWDAENRRIDASLISKKTQEITLKLPWTLLGDKYRTITLPEGERVRFSLLPTGRLSYEHD